MPDFEQLRTAQDGDLVPRGRPGSTAPLPSRRSFWAALLVVFIVGVSASVTWAVTSVYPRPNAEWRVIGFTSLADDGQVFIVKGASHDSRKGCYRAAVRLQAKTSDITFACAQIFPGGEW